MSIWLIHILILFMANSSSVCEVNDNGESSCATLCETDKWISQNGTVPGYHVLCITKDTTTNALNIKFYREGVAAQTYAGQYISNAKNFKQLRNELE
eukprot:763073_1